MRSVKFEQENECMSTCDVMRDLHFNALHSRKANWCVVSMDQSLMAVDIRKGSSTYGQHVAVELTEANHRQFFIPKVFPMVSLSSQKQLSSNINAMSSIIQKQMVAFQS